MVHTHISTWPRCRRVSLRYDAGHISSQSPTLFSFCLYGLNSRKKHALTSSRMVGRAGSVVAASTAGGAAFFATSSDRYHASCSVKGVHVGSEPVVWVVTAAMVEGGGMQLVLTKREPMPAEVEQPPAATTAAGGDDAQEEEQEGMQTVEERAEAAAAAQGRAAAEVRRVLLLAGDDANTQDEGGEVEDEGYVLLDSTAFTVDGFLRYMGLAGGGEEEAAAAASSRAAADNTWTDAITDVVPVPRAGEASRA